MPPAGPWNLFEAFGVELEYMIVSSETLDVLPICDRILADEAGETTMALDVGSVGWSNELALHVIEIKTAQPVGSLEDLPATFAGNVDRILTHAARHGARLMPTAMHPWMDPATQLRLWPHENGPIYQAFDRIFNCRGHGWANLQSMHINLPFADTSQFGRLHAAVRLVLPLLPALAASSPIVDGQLTGIADNRLAAYAVNCRRVPSVTGRVIPEPVFDIGEYQDVVLKGIYRDIAPHDPEGILQKEWLNARGAIARFDRGAIEIRVIDVQECPAADVAVAALAVEVLRHLVDETWSSLQTQKQWATDTLADVFDQAVRLGGQAEIHDAALLMTFGMRQSSASLAQLWAHLADEVVRRRAPAIPSASQPALEVLLGQGCLSSRIASLTGGQPDRGLLQEVYERLCDCLAGNRPLRI